jgi:hypothetical protein
VVEIAGKREKCVMPAIEFKSKVRYPLKKKYDLQVEGMIKGEYLCVVDDV